MTKRKKRQKHSHGAAADGSFLRDVRESFDFTRRDLARDAGVT
ncbi:hypothetical protein [Sutterella sp.]|nr:hypothetical protein [Sutterella sp.]MDO5532558.1 hypothetical protein [Sutterella sp.]